MRQLLICTALIFSTTMDSSRASEGYSLEESIALRQQWNIDDWDEGGPLMRYVFLNMSEFWNHSIIHRSGPIRTLPAKSRSEVARFRVNVESGEMPLDDYVNASTVNGAIVLHKGDIVYESYPRMRPYDKHLYMSVSKSLAATLIAILEDRELVDVETSIETYLPTLAGSGWDGVSVRDILDMASGIGCLELEAGAYTDPSKCYYQYEASLGWLRRTAETADNAFDYMPTLESHRPAGEAFEYTSPNTFILGWLAEEVTGRTLVELLSEEIWQKIGAESDAIIIAPRFGVPIISGGISSTLRDMARFGLQFTPSGRKDQSSFVSERYLHNIQQGGRPEIFNAARDEPRMVAGEPALHNSYQWDFVMEDGDFFKSGYGGQGLYVSTTHDLVVAFFGTFDENRKGHEMTDIARQLATSGLFD